MKVTVKYTNRKRKNKHGFMKRMGTKSGRAILARRRKRGRREISAQLNFSISSSEFSKIVKTSKSLSIGDLSFKYSPWKRPVLGLSVAINYGNAVARNLFKRRCRELFKMNFANKGLRIAIIIRPLKKNILYSDMEIAFIELCDKISY